MDDPNHQPSIAAYDQVQLIPTSLCSENPISFSLAQQHQVPSEWSSRYVIQAIQEPWNWLSGSNNVDLEMTRQGHSVSAIPAFTEIQGRDMISDCTTSVHDSGYQSLPPHVATSTGQASVYGNEDCQDTDVLLQGFHLGQAPVTLEGPGSSGVHITAASPFTPSSLHIHRCEHCNETLKTKSELRKHLQRHTKPFMCTLAACKRNGQGFSTRNDLERHRRTTHREFDQAKAYYCTHDCADANKQKPWPRADNFRQHLERIHRIRMSAEDDLSRYQIRITPTEEPTGAQPSPTVSEDVKGMEGAIPEADETFAGLALPEFNDSISQGGPFAADIDSTLMVSLFERPELRTTASMYTDPENLLMPNDDVQTVTNQRLLAIELDMGNWEQSMPGKDLSLDVAKPDATDDYQTAEGQTNMDVNESFAFDARQPDSPSSESEWRSRGDSDTMSDAVVSLSVDVASATDVARCIRDNVSRDVWAKAFDMLTKDAPIPESSGSPRGEPVPICGTCNKKFKRPCELRKHERRHERPYLCTSYNCGAKFGSKNDWKRHERGQHLHLDQWMCGLDGCEKSCTCKEDLKSHLTQVHGIRDEKLIADQLREDRPGLHNDRSFWCGFCNNYKAVSDPEKNTWLVRFDHIDDHVCGRKGLRRQSMDEWVFVENRPKTRQSKRKRGANQTRESGSASWACCRCSDAIWNGFEMDAACISCHHPRCANCNVTPATAPSRPKRRLVYASSQRRSC